MPTYPLWFQRLPDILAHLRELTTPFLDRQAFEKLFRVKDRRARVLMAGLDGIQIGNAWAIERVRLIESLERIQEGVKYQTDHTARQGVRQRIAAVIREGKEAAAGSRTVAVIPQNTADFRFSNLPAGVSLSRSELKIEFSGFPDMAEKLALFTQALMYDPASFERFLGGVEPSSFPR